MYSPAAKPSCPICRTPPPCWRLTRHANGKRPQVYACKGCGIVFTDAPRFYTQQPQRHLRTVGCRICGCGSFNDITRPGAPDGLTVGMCQGCSLVFLPDLWLRETSERAFKRQERERR